MCTIYQFHTYTSVSLMAQPVKNLPAMRRRFEFSWGCEISEEEMVTHTSIRPEKLNAQEPAGYSPKGQ